MIDIPTHIGTTQTGVFNLHEDAVTQGFALLAMRDSGKSNLAGVMQEEFARRGDQFIVLDPPAAHIGMRNTMGPDGHPAGPSGIQVLIVGGDNADCPLPVERGRELAQVLMDTKASCIINLKTARAKERKDFLTEFGEELYAYNRTPLHLFLEEADEIIPQQPDNREEQAIRHIWRKIIKGGRSSGLGFTIISQRPAMIDKSSLNQVDNLIVMALMGAADLKAIEDWLKFHVRDKNRMTAIMQSIPALKQGEAWLLSPRWLKAMVQFQARRRVTFHAGRTPKRGEVAVAPVKYDVGEIAERFKAKLAEKQALELTGSEETAIVQQQLSIAQRDNEMLTAKLGDANDRIDELIARLGDANDWIEEEHKDAQRRVEQVYLQGVEHGYRKAQEPILKILTDIQNVKLPEPILIPPDLAPLPKLPLATQQAMDDVHAHIERAMSVPPIALGRREPEVRTIEAIQRVRDSDKAVHASNGINRPRMEILERLAEFKSMGRDPVRDTWVAGSLGTTVRSRGFEENVRALRVAGLLDKPAGDTMALTLAGVRKVGHRPAVSGRYLREKLFSLLSGPQQEYLQTIIQRGSLQLEELAGKVGTTVRARGFEENIRFLRSNEIISVQGGWATPAQWLK